MIPALCCLYGSSSKPQYRAAGFAIYSCSMVKSETRGESGGGGG